MKETIAIAIGPVVIAMMIIVAWCLPKIQQQRFDHEYRMAQHKEAVEQNTHRRYRELEQVSKVPSDLELQAQIAEANASQAEHEAEKAEHEIELERERDRY